VSAITYAGVVVVARHQAQHDALWTILLVQNLLPVLVLAVPAVTTSWPAVKSPAGTAIVGAATSREKVVVADCPPAEAPIVTLFVPTLVGIPEITPPPERVSPRRSPEETL
jgi:hypothetical protein